jgi:UDP-galactose transporter B1
MARDANGTSGAVHSFEKKMEEQAESLARNPQEQHEAGLGQLVICVGGIYASLSVSPYPQYDHYPNLHSLSWAYLQERLTTTSHGPTNARFHYAIFLNTVQSAFAAITGLIYLIVSAPRDPTTRARRIPPIFPPKRFFSRCS